MEQEKDKKLEELLIEICIKIAKRGEGALFVIGEVEYKTMVEQEVPKFNSFNNPKLLESLALMDGAIILNQTGEVQAYGAMVKSKKVFKNFGTRHSAAVSASIKEGNTSIIVSEEDRKVRILKKGKVVMQLDALQKNIEKSVPEAVNILESVGVGTIGTIGAGIVAPSLGIALLPGIILFGSGYYLMRIISNKLKNSRKLFSFAFLPFLLK